MPQPSNKFCGNCLYWEKLTLTESKFNRLHDGFSSLGESYKNKIGRCRMSVPVFVDAQTVGMWPLVLDSQWCGEWKAVE